MMICSKYVLLSWTLVLVCSCSGINESVGLVDDNIVEQAVELLIENQTGLDIDLTPSSPTNLT